MGLLLWGNNKEWGQPGDSEPAELTDCCFLNKFRDDAPNEGKVPILRRIKLAPTSGKRCVGIGCVDK